MIDSNKTHIIPAKQQAYIFISAPKRGKVNLENTLQYPIVSANLSESIEQFEQTHSSENLIGILPLFELLKNLAIIEKCAYEHNLEISKLISLATDLIVNEKDLPEGEVMGYLLFTTPKNVADPAEKNLRQEAVITENIKISVEKYNETNPDRKIEGVISLGQILTNIALIETYAERKGYDFAALVDAASELVDV